MPTPRAASCPRPGLLWVLLSASLAACGGGSPTASTPATETLTFTALVGKAGGTGVLVADLDLEVIDEVRNVWQFYRDRRPETYEDLVKLLP